MRLSVAFGTRANEYAWDNVRRILGCLSLQTFQDFEVLVVCDRFFEQKEEFHEWYEKLESALRSA